MRIATRYSTARNIRIGIVWLLVSPASQCEHMYSMQQYTGHDPLWFLATRLPPGLGCQRAHRAPGPGSDPRVHVTVPCDAQSRSPLGLRQSTLGTCKSSRGIYKLAAPTPSRSNGSHVHMCVYISEQCSAGFVHGAHYQSITNPSPDALPCLATTCRISRLHVRLPSR